MLICPFRVLSLFSAVLLMGILGVPMRAADEAPARSKVAVFPLAGDGDAGLRQRIGFSLRAKIDREGTYEAVSGVEMGEAVGAEKFAFASKVDAVEKVATALSADIGIWGELVGTTLKVKVFDFRQLDPLPFEITHKINKPTDVRFVSEAVLQHLADVKRFEHPSEQAVNRDEEAEKLWATNPNLVINGDFARAGGWERLYRAERDLIKASSALPSADNVVIYAITEADGTPNKVLAMNLSRTAAENNGLAALSAPIKIEPNTRYRLRFRYNSDGPKLHVFVKGYTTVPDANGGTTEREIYRRQLPPTAGTDGQWVTIDDDLNPQHVTFPVLHLRIDLYAYLQPGLVMFDDVVLKAIGKPTRKAVDDAIDAPTTRRAK
jgi:hypothetical protein